MCINTKIMEQLQFKQNDGGRSRYFKGVCGDCVTRSIAIASGRDYKEVYNIIYKITGESPRNGVTKKNIQKIMKTLGYKWVSKMSIGSGVTCHLAKNEVPMDATIICNCSKHLVAVVNGVVNDNHDCRRDGTRAVYGYWIVNR